MTTTPLTRTFSKDKYITAGIITFLIFALGLTLGFIIDQHRYNIVEEINMEQEVKYLSLQTQYLYLNSYHSFNNNSCPILSATLKSTVQDLSDSLSEVVSYEEEQKTTDKRRDIIMRRYAIDNLRYLLLAQEGKQKCNLDLVTITYFYSSDCPSCPNQGVILTYFKKIFGEKVLIFPSKLDYRSQEPMIEIAMAQFNITKYPTIIVDNNKYEGVIKKEELQTIICNSIKDSPQCQLNIPNTSLNQTPTSPHDQNSTPAPN